MNYLNKDLHPLIENGDFSEAAPQLFGKDFEKCAKEHIDSIKSLRKISQIANQGAPGTRGLAESSLRPSCPWGQQLPRRQLQRKRPISAILEQREPSKRQKLLSNLITTPEIVYVYKNMSVVLKFQLSMIQTLQNKGISDVVTNMAAQTDLPFAARITHFILNWEEITQDTWVL